jgi:hypothetical protein
MKRNYLIKRVLLGESVIFFKYNTYEKKFSLKIRQILEQS